MAKCEKRPIFPDPPPSEYVLTMNEDEARAVCLALGNCDVKGTFFTWQMLRDALEHAE